jgi:hypothetical protein
LHHWQERRVERAERLVEKIDDPGFAGARRIGRRDNARGNRVELGGLDLTENRERRGGLGPNATQNSFTAPMLNS